jgi:hypothetical protein
VAVSHLWRARNDLRRALPRSVLGLEPSVVTPCCPKRIVLVLPSALRATTIHDFVGWLGVRFGLLYSDTPAFFSLGSDEAMLTFLFVRCPSLNSVFLCRCSCRRFSGGGFTCFGVRIFFPINFRHTSPYLLLLLNTVTLRFLCSLLLLLYSIEMRSKNFFKFLKKIRTPLLLV